MVAELEGFELSNEKRARGCLGYAYIYIYMGVSKNRGGPPKSSIFIGFSLINHPFWGTTSLEAPI